jgi:hypothetical protein
MLLIVLQMLVLMLLLMVNGEPARFFLLRRLKFFSDLDSMQVCILDVYLGGMIFYALAMLPFRLYTWAIVLGFTAVNSLLFLLIHSRSLVRVAGFRKIRTYLRENKRASLDYIIVFALFMFFLIINLIGTAGFVFGSVRDESIHSLSVEVILENNQIPVTLQPYIGEGIIYPQASHVIFAFACYILNMDVPKAVFYGSILFKSLSVLGAYFLGKKISPRRVSYLGLSFVLTFVSSWPLYVAWGGNPFLVGFPLFLVSLGLLVSLVRLRTNVSFVELMAVGLIFGYDGVLVISYLETLFMIAFLIIVYLFVRKYDHMRRSVLVFLAVCSVSLLPMSPFLYRFFSFFRYPGHNIGIASDFSEWPNQQVFMAQALQWPFENISPYLSLRLLMAIIIVSLVILHWRTRGFKRIKTSVALAASVFVGASLLSLISFFLPADFTVVSWGHQGVILSISLNILIVVFYVKLIDFCRGRRLGHSVKVLSRQFHSATLLAIVLSLVTTAPFVYTRVFVDPGNLRGTYGLFAVTTQNDYDLMNWMKDNLPSNAVILVNPYGAGLFIPPISHHRIVFPYSSSSLSSSYQTLVDLLKYRVLNETVYELMQHWNISHVYVSSRVAFWWLGGYEWDYRLFLGNPNFDLTKRVGDAYLFEVNYKNSSAVFLDDFERGSWEETGWQTDFAGNGLGNVTIEHDSDSSNSRSLLITAQSVPTVSEWKYGRWVYREIFVPNDSDVTLSFHFGAIHGFSGNDTFAVLISNVNHNESLVITTPHGIYESYGNAISLKGFEGSCEFSGNQSLSTLWRHIYGESLPNQFLLQFVNWDFDGVENVAYIGDVVVTSTPSS